MPKLFFYIVYVNSNSLLGPKGPVSFSLSLLYGDVFDFTNYGEVTLQGHLCTELSLHIFIFAQSSF